MSFWVLGRSQRFCNPDGKLIERINVPHSVLGSEGVSYRFQTRDGISLKMVKDDRLSLLVNDPSYLNFMAMTIVQASNFILRNKNMPLSMMKHIFPQRQRNNFERLAFRRADARLRLLYCAILGKS